jgi:hypothetical protein
MLNRPTNDLNEALSLTRAHRRPRRCVFEIGDGADTSSSCVVLDTVVG